MENLVSLRSLFLDYMMVNTNKEVQRGGHVFGGVLIRKPKNLSLSACNFQEDVPIFEILAVGTNRRHLNPLWHGEVDTINRHYLNLNEKKYTIEWDDELYLIASHQPCLMCSYSMSWVPNLTNVYYLFDYDETNEMFDMPTDIDQWNMYMNNMDYTSPYKILGESNKFRTFSKLAISKLLKAELAFEYLKMFETVKKVERGENIFDELSK